MGWGFKTCGPNEALIVSGCCYGSPYIVVGGRVFVWPFIQQIQRLSLTTITVNVETPNVYTRKGVPISVTGVAQVRIQGKNKDMLLTACEQFLNMTEPQIRDIALASLEGHQRAIMGSLSVEEIFEDRKKFNELVFEVASSDLLNMGITVISYTLKHIHYYSDDEEFRKSLRLARTAKVKRNARIGEAKARAEAHIKEALAREQHMASVFKNDTQVAKARRDYELKKAANNVEVQTQKAEAAFAYALQAAKTKQQIKHEEMQIKVVERTQQAALQQQEVDRRTQELEATVIRPAQAEKYRLEKIAEANHKRVVLEAEAEAEAIRLKGEAEAFALEAKARAEAEQMAEKADAWREYRRAAMVDMCLNVLPKITSEVAMPIAHANKITMVSVGEGEIGIAGIAGEVVSIVSCVSDMVGTMTDVDFLKLMKTEEDALVNPRIHPSWALKSCLLH